MDSQELTFATRGRDLVDITSEVSGFCQGKGDGLVHLFAPHATAGLAVMELGSGSEPDLEELLDRLLPRDDRYTHRHGATVVLVDLNQDISERRVRASFLAG